MALKVLELTKEVAEKGNVNSISDAGVSALMAKAALEGAIYNVKINIGGLNDRELVEKLSSEIKILQERSTSLADDVRRIVESKF